MMEIFIASEAPHGCRNGYPFDSRALTQVRHFENRTSCVGYPDGETICPTFQRKIHRDVMTVQQATRIADSSIYIEHIINLMRHWVRLIRRLKIV
jgi:hypothetical protein